MGASDYIALGSLIIALGSIIWTALTDRKLKKQALIIQEYQIKREKNEEDERKKAIIKATAIKEPSGIRHLIVENCGLGTAKNIMLVLNETDSETSGISFHFDKNPFPLLHPGDSFKGVIFIVNGHNHSPKIKFVWNDDFCLDNEREQILSL